MSLLIAMFSAAAQQAQAAPPITAGGAIQQIPQAPELQPPAPIIPEASSPPPIGLSETGPTFTARSLRITGATRFPSNVLLDVAGFRPGAVLGLNDLRNMAARITRFYNRSGLILAQAYLPAQDVSNGAVTIAVLEGWYGRIGVGNTTNIADVRLVDMLDGLNSGDAIEARPLQRRLLIMSDRPGINVAATLAPGQAVGTADLLVSVSQRARVDGSLEADNAGNPYTGRYRVGGTVNFNEPLGIGDLLSARILASTTGGLKYGRAFYQTAVGDATIGVAYAIFDYHLGKQFSVLEATGTEQIASLYGSYPVIRSYDSNLNVFTDFDYRKLHDRLGIFSSSTDKQAFVGSVGIDGNTRDTLLGGGLNSYTLTASGGDLDIETPEARAIDSVTARTDGAYAKFSFDVSRLQHVAGPLSLYAEVRGQVASKNLDESEKMELGGASEVRAFPEGEAYGDEGYVATLEARLLLPKWPARLPGNFELVGFVDNGEVRLNTNPFFRGPNTATRSGAGAGLIWSAPNNFTASIFYAHEIGNQAATSYTNYGDETIISLVKYF